MILFLLSNRLRYLYPTRFFHNTPISSTFFHSPTTTQPTTIPNKTLTLLIIPPPPNPSSCSSYSSYSRPTKKPKPPRRKRSKKSLPIQPQQDLITQITSQLPPRFTPEDLSQALSHHSDPYLCLHLFTWASHQPRFNHDVSTFLITIKKLGSARLYPDMDSVASQALSLPLSSLPSSEPLFNTIIYFYSEARMLSKAINAYKRMRTHPDPLSRPSVRTFNLLFAALLGKGTNSYINHFYMETIRCLFRQMLDSGVDPDLFSLNSMVKGYVLSLHLNDALRIFHQMETVYRCPPNEHSYNYLVHGLCAQGRTNNAKELYGEMRGKGFVPSEKACNSLVCALAMAGEVQEAVGVLWEMGRMRRLGDRITYRTVVDEMCRQGRVGDARELLRELQEKELVDGRSYRELLHGIQDDYGGDVCDSNGGYVSHRRGM